MLKSLAAVQPSRPLVLAFAYMAAFTLAMQTAHMVEHIVQVIQKFVIASPEAHGLVGQLDLEQVHFWFNTSYLAALALVFVGWLVCRNDVSKCTNHLRAFTLVLLFGVLFQAFHETEHAVKLAQFMATGMQGTPGILGAHFNPVLLHFMYNLLVYLPLVIVFFGARLYRLPRMVE